MNIQEFEVKVNLPKELKPLETIAYNLWWAWNTEAQDLYKATNEKVWAATRNPIEVISAMTEDDYTRLLSDEIFMLNLQDVYQTFQHYMELPRWYSKEHSKHKDMLVAYFSAEYGIHESVQLYSGGLGILSGDHCKSTSEMGIPLIAVGLLYRNGYFHQYTNSDGWQQEQYPYNEFYMMPIKPALDKEGNQVYVAFNIGAREVKIKVWQLQVGLMTLVLLDTDLAENHPDDRIITGKLYDGEQNMRIRQEMVLGIGGCRALKACGIEPTVYHLNEGHPAFAAIERISQLHSEGLDLRLASEVVKKSTLFTTHTPVPAGFDVFSYDQIKNYISGLYEHTGLNMNMLMSFGRFNRTNDTESFNMAIAGINLSTYRNGVSMLHGEVSRDMFKSLWPHAFLSQVPIGHVTNGVHLPTFMSGDMKKILSRYVYEDWENKPYKFDMWDKAVNIPDNVIFDMKRNQRERLVSFIRRRTRESARKRGGSVNEMMQAEDILNPDALTIGFARRFATYKRAYLLFMDEARLSKIVNDKERPVQFVIAGKAHPKDNDGKEYIKKIIQIARKPEFRNHIVFLEDYDIEVARYLTRGVDVWLNNPRRPMEASGTSGMKASANGALNFSVLDGWWVEGFNGMNGWAIGSGEEYPQNDYQDFVEGMDIYNRLENDLVPTFYNRDSSGMPREWLKMIKENFKTIPAFFNSNRMLMDYTNQYYVPLHELQQEFNANNYDEARKYNEWYTKVLSQWDGIKFVDTAVEGDTFAPSEVVTFKAKIDANGAPDEHLGVFVTVEFGGDSSTMVDPKIIRLEKQGDEFVGTYRLDSAGRLKVAFLVTPYHKFLRNPFELNKVKWA